MDYTKGEWKVTKDITFRIRTKIKYICDLSSWHLHPDEVRANAYLIAAAPEMYEACRALIEHLTMDKGELGRPYLADVKRMAYKALAKAEKREEGNVQRDI